ncbi:MAG: mannose-1-phosphate guanylyltransferase [Candidatus Kapaibacterium sp.]|nr:MAG: mannose-1-phosphate guanylyltransferase [Candidatus Kapabacteria bacterium]
MKTFAVILAGGGGVRLWPHSREHKPKQFLTLFGNKSLLQHTYERLRETYAHEEIMVVTSQQLRALAGEQLRELREENFIIEPFGRNTAAAIGLALITLQYRMEEEFTLAVFPADHIVSNVRDFVYATSLCAETAAITDGIISLGVPPTRPDTGLGYIQAFDETPRVVDAYASPLHAMRKVLTFAEKPDIETAIRFVNSGDFLWNTGIFFARGSVLWRSFEEFMPDHAHVLRLLQKHFGKDSYNSTIAMLYRQMKSISIDYGIMEKARSSYVVEGAFDWSDLASWDSMYQLAAKDAADNVLEGEVIAVNVSNSYVKAGKRLITLVDIDDVLVVDSDDALVICRIGHGQSVKEVVDFLRRKQMKDFL